MLLTVEHQRHLITLLGCGFELQCQDNAPVIINMMDINYIVLETNSSIPNNRDITVSHVTSTVADTANGNCTNKVNVPVLTTAARAFEATEVSIEYAIDEGFELEIRVVEHL
ncbi:hypothetical protein ACFX2I_015065 [Malus domestica]